MDSEGGVPVWPPPPGTAEELAVGCESGEQREAWAELFTWMSSTQAPIKPTGCKECGPAWGRGWAPRKEDAGKGQPGREEENQAGQAPGGVRRKGEGLASREAGAQCTRG